jgi:hypothetical protein
MLFIAPIHGILEGWTELPFPIPFNGSTTVVEVQVGQEDIGDVIAVESVCREALVQGIIPMQVIVLQELLVLLGANACIEEHKTVFILHE